MRRPFPLLRVLAPALICLALAVTAPGAAVSAVDAVGITVSDLDRSVDFFTRVLSFQKVSRTESWGEEIERATGVFGARVRTARLSLGDESIELTEYLAPRGRPYPIDSRSNDRWFQHVAIIVSDMDRAYAHLRRHKVEHASPGPQTLPAWNPNAGGIRAFYFKDPDGHPLEILWFPPGKGDPKWHRRTGRLFLGIDHTAIVSDDTDESLSFYRDLLGMRVAGESENYGQEQERLNNVFGAHLRITALRSPSGPGIELLEYLAPRDGRPQQADRRANDLYHWQTRLTAPDAGEILGKLRGARFGTLGLLVLDPDGHAVSIVESVKPMEN